MNRTIVVDKFTDNYDDIKRNIISKVLLEKYGIDNYELKYNKNGKPYLNNNIFISISNDDEYLLIVFDTIPIGADIMIKKTINSTLKRKYHKEKLSDDEFIREFSIGESIIKLLDKNIYDIFDYNINLYDINVIENDSYIISIVNEKKPL